MRHARHPLSPGGGARDDQVADAAARPAPIAPTAPSAPTRTTRPPQPPGEPNGIADVAGLHGPPSVGPWGAWTRAASIAAGLGAMAALTGGALLWKLG